MTEAPCALAIGNFDGVHLGHQKLLAETVAFAREHGVAPATLTFHPHPTVIVAPDRVPPLICSLDERIRLIESTGIQQVFVVPFTNELAALSPREFVSEFLVNRFCARALFVGENFRFGVKKGRNNRYPPRPRARIRFHASLPRARHMSRRNRLELRRS